MDSEKKDTYYYCCVGPRDFRFWRFLFTILLYEIQMKEIQSRLSSSKTDLIKHDFIRHPQLITGWRFILDSKVDNFYLNHLREAPVSQGHFQIPGVWLQMGIILRPRFPNRQSGMDTSR